jgi:hypothetical protein
MLRAIILLARPDRIGMGYGERAKSNGPHLKLLDTGIGAW